MILALLAAAGAAPTTTAFQGRLLDADGTALNGTRTLDVHLYDVATGGAPAWTERHAPPLADGYFSLILGQSSPLTPALVEGPAWVGVTDVASGAELLRAPLTAVPTAIVAGSVAGGSVVADSVQVGATAIAPTGVSTPRLSVGDHLQQWSVRVGGRGGSASDDLWWLGTIDANDYDNAGLIIETCSASRWDFVGCSTTFVAFGHYSGNPSQPAGDEVRLTTTATSPSPYKPVPIRTAFVGSTVGQRKLAVYAAIGSTWGNGYDNAVFSLRGLGFPGEFTEGDGSRVAASSVTLNP